MKSILTELLKDIDPEFRDDFGRFKDELQKLKSSNTATPHFIHMCAIPGAGKTTIAKPLYQNHLKQQSFFYLGFDDIMERLDGYQTMALKYPALAFETYMPKAANIGYHLLNEALDANLSIIFDHGGTPLSHIRFMEALTPHHRTIIYLPCDLETAIKRARLREKETKRHVPISMIKERYQKTNEQLELYQKVADNFIEWSSEQSSDADIAKLYKRIMP